MYTKKKYPNNMDFNNFLEIFIKLKNKIKFDSIKQLELNRLF